MVQNVYAIKFDTLNKLHQAIRFLKVNQYDYKELIGYNTIYVLDINLLEKIDFDEVNIISYEAK